MENDRLPDWVDHLSRRLKEKDDIIKNLHKVIQEARDSIALDLEEVGYSEEEIDDHPTIQKLDQVLINAD